MSPHLRVLLRVDENGDRILETGGAFERAPFLNAMSGLLRRLTRRRPATADETGTPEPASSEPAGAPAETPTEPGGGQPVPATGEQATQVLPATGEETVAIPARPPVRDLPAGVDPAEFADAPAASAPRGKLRRRLRYLRRVRELLLRDLGGFTFEIHRTLDDKPEDAQRRLSEGKLERIAALDTEIRALEERLGEPHETVLLREPGIGGTCPECGELHASDAHYCSRCGAPLDAKARARRDAAVAAAAQQQTTSHPTAEPAPASVLWAAGPQPAASAEPEAEAEEPRSEVTSQWLALPPREEKVADEPAPEPKPKPKRTPAKKPSAEEQPTAEEPKLEPAGEEPTFEPTPNGRPAEQGDALTSRRDQTT
jgi:hypothetical protein